MMTRNRTQLLLQLAAAFLLVLGIQARTWTSADSSKTFKGELQSYDAASGKVSVTLPNGKRMTFPQEKLSAEDIAWLKKNGAPSGGSTTEVGELPDELPDPDGEEADMSKPVQVYILMGQSNMLGAGKPGKLQGIAAEKYPYLIDEAGDWTVRKDVRNVFVMCSGNSPACCLPEASRMSMAGKHSPVTAALRMIPVATPVATCPKDGMPVASTTATWPPPRKRSIISTTTTRMPRNTRSPDSSGGRATRTCAIPHTSKCMRRT